MVFGNRSCSFHRATGFPDAVLSLAAAELADGVIERAEHLLRALLADRRAGALDRARAQGLLGDALSPFLIGVAYSR